MLKNLYFKMQHNSVTHLLNISHYFGINAFSTGERKQLFAFSIGNNTWFGLDG